MKQDIGQSRIENEASKAITRSALGMFNLGAARATLSQMLAEIGRTAEFATYTKHDITHIDALLESTDWIIPAATWNRLTVADALVIVLSIYVHDLGMLVTKREFARREQTNFPVFKEGLLSDDSARGVDFRSRMGELRDEDKEHFLYEEFVRTHHAERIESWVSGKEWKQFGYAEEAVELVDEVFKDLPTVIRSDVAMVARSHHLDDLEDVKKYKLNRAYGGAIADVANLQYAAIVLRTADLVHMTRDRTPTIQYRLSSPTDPMGQREWRKQAAVRAVIPHIGQAGAESVIEIHASFEEPESYFALMEYLDYCDTQLKLSRKWIEAARYADERVTDYQFPWFEIARDQIEAIGFNRNQFSFKFDQQKVLDLLTGHTLYNDSSVAIRELTQNAIDAVRLQAEISQGAPSDTDVVVEYDTETRLLRIRDRGTGMTEEALRSHFLKVGSSSYQTKEFKEQHPNFASISRFGIGVLSAFMIADEVKVATVSSDEARGRQLVLKSVHGRYLMRDLDVESEAAGRIGPHGTEIELRIRPSSGLQSTVLELLRRWILVPRCSVSCVIDDEPPVSIGWAGAREALVGLLATEVRARDEIRVVEKVFGETVVAVAEIWNPVYKEWELVRTGDSSRARRVVRSLQRERSYVPAIAGVSVQGIRVTGSLPGWVDPPMILVDVSGAEAPRTNVARTDLEAGPNLDALVDNIYRAVIGSIEDQVPQIAAGTSQRLALREAQHLYAHAMTTERGVAFDKPKAMADVVSGADLVPVERKSILERTSAAALKEVGFRVLVGPAADDAARFMEWLPQPQGLMTILRGGGLLKDVEDSDQPLLAGTDALFAYHELLWGSFEMVSVTSLERGKSLLIEMANKEGRWERDDYDPEFVSAVNSLTHKFERSRSFRRSEHANMYAVSDDINFVGLPNQADIVFVANYRIFGPTSVFSRARKAVDAEDESVRGLVRAALYLLAQFVSPFESPRNEDEVRALAELTGWLANDDQVFPQSKALLLEVAHQAFELPVWSTARASQRRGDQ